MGVYVVTPGALTSIQDGGRFGRQGIGMSPAGAMDAHSMRLANILVDNDADEGVLEATVTGPTLRFDEPCVFALAGADMNATLDGTPVPCGRAVAARRGAVLRLGVARFGCRCYIAVAGGFDVPLLYGSKSTLLRSRLGGLGGRALAKGDTLRLAAPRDCLPNMRLRALVPPPRTAEPFVARVVMGPQDDRFTNIGIETFLNCVYTVDTKSDRMGCRLTGAKVEHAGDANIISDGVPMGGVQIPGDGDPIVMMSEHQGMGGYPKIACVISVDLPVIAQSAPGHTLRFRAVTVEEAQALYKARLKEYEKLRDRFSKPQTNGVFYAAAKNYRVTVNGVAYDVRVESA